MRFTKILHPEIVLDKRGPKMAREIIRESTDALKFAEGGVVFNVSDSEIGRMVALNLKTDPVFLRFMISCKWFKDKRASTYHIGRDFLQTLKKIDREIPLDILPESFIAYFSFSENTIFDDDGPVDGGYVGIDYGRNIGMSHELKDSRILTFAYVNSTESLLGPFTSLTIPIDSKKISDLAAGAPIEDFVLEKRTSEQIEKRNEVFRALLNAVIYLHSDNPNIEKSRPFRETGLSARKMRRRSSIINDCSVPVHFLFRDYVKSRIYSVESTWVDSFPRWQRCGPNLSRVKLIFVSPHERKFSSSDNVVGPI